MASSILQTKLYIPPTRPEVLTRSRLIDRLNEGLHRKLTLISAPAGFGKTTLVSDWLHQSGSMVAWVSLEEADNEPIRFLSYIVAAIYKTDTTIGQGLLAVLQSSQPPPIDSILTALLNEINTVQETFVIILDDYHVIQETLIDEALTFLLNHLPSQIHLVVTTREDPALPIARYRARGQLSEVRAADLRFTDAEAEEFFNQMMGFSLSADEITTLENRTEGWIAGLQLAALSMQGRNDVSEFINTFAGDNRYIIDYLVEEVLQGQSEQIRNFLLQTSILQRLNGSLCAAVTNQLDAKQMLENLDRSNLFLIQLDDNRQWYRYHHLFSDVLQSHLMDTYADHVPILHQRASEWFEQNGEIANAIHHAHAMMDIERIAGLAELAWPIIPKGIQPTTWLGWAKSIPEDMIRTRPVLSAAYAYIHIDLDDLDAADLRLRDVEWWLEALADDNPQREAFASELVVVNEAQFESLAGTTASARAYLAQGQGELHSTIEHGQRALNLLPQTEYYWRGGTTLFMGAAQWALGDLDAARLSFNEAVTSMQKAQNRYFHILAITMLADMQVVQGQLLKARSIYEQALALTAYQATGSLGRDQTSIVEEPAYLYVGLGDLYLQWNDLEAATQYINWIFAVHERAIMRESVYRLFVMMARIKEAEGDLDAALDLLQDAEQHHQRTAIPDFRPIASIRARLWLKLGRINQAIDWVKQQGLSIQDDFGYLDEYTYITLARILIAVYQGDQKEQTIHDAFKLLERLHQVAEAGGRITSIIEILILQSLVYQLQEDLPNALVLLEHALALAEPEGYIRVFADEGQPMRTLLAESLRRGSHTVYITQLLSAMTPQTIDASTVSDPNQLLIEPLSERELDVLHLLSLGHSNQAIADELVIALSTVKKHVNNIFGKLGVGNRTQAVTRARELHLI